MKENDTISRQAAIDALCNDYCGGHQDCKYYPKCENLRSIQNLPSARSEQLTDKEQRIFLAAMEREEKVCEEVDRNYVREPYEESLMRVCKEIRRKVKGALWT